jgi:dCMP deaminase
MIKKEEEMSRPNWNQYFFDLLETVSKRATCDRGKTGCMIVKDNRILVTGYVGSPPGFPHCDDVGHQIKKVIHEDGSTSEHCCRTIHAEQNAICEAAKRGVSINGATVYVKMTPCRVCAMLLISCGIREVKCQRKYHRGIESEEMFKEANINLTFEEDSIQEY